MSCQKAYQKRSSSIRKRSKGIPERSKSIPKCPKASPGAHPSFQILCPLCHQILPSLRVLSLIPSAVAADNNDRSSWEWLVNITRHSRQRVPAAATVTRTPPNNGIRAVRGDKELLIGLDTACVYLEAFTYVQPNLLRKNTLKV